MKRLLVIVDMQADFVSGALPCPNAETAVKNTLSLIDREEKRGTEVVYTQDFHGRDYLDTQEGKRLPVPHCILGTLGAEFVDGIYRDGAMIFRKTQFASRDLADYARNGDYGEVIFAGFCTDVCVISNAILIKAYMPETTVKVSASCCAGTTAENHEAALKVMRCCQIDVTE